MKVLEAVHESGDRHGDQGQPQARPLPESWTDVASAASPTDIVTKRLRFGLSPGKQTRRRATAVRQDSLALNRSEADTFISA
jgi:hypothetical protein